MTAGLSEMPDVELAIAVRDAARDEDEDE